MGGRVRGRGQGAHVTRHTSHVTRHSSHVTRHMLPPLPPSCAALTCFACAMAQEARELDRVMLMQQHQLRAEAQQKQQQQQQQQQHRGFNSVSALAPSDITTDFVVDLLKRQRWVAVMRGRSAA